MSSQKCAIIISLIYGLTHGHNTFAEGTIMSPHDPNSFSRPDLVVVKHMKIEAEPDFDTNTFSASVVLFGKRIDRKARILLLDTDNLNITSVVNQKTGSKLYFELSQYDEYKMYGTQLRINLPRTKGFEIGITYKTHPRASGILWLKPVQTVGKVHPYLFTQFQTIGARSFVPCQDTPGSKITYEATIKCPDDLRVAMAAKVVSAPYIENSSALYRFKQDIPVATYLIAFAIGALETRNISSRTAVYTEKELVESAAYELANIEEQLRTATDIAGPYVWGRYDVLILPSSFPYSGMENPSLTFTSPIVLAGDRSMVYIISHEISHSWSGNLVTNANYEHFWLNEGVTTFVERRIGGRMNGKASEDFEAYRGLTFLKDAVNRMGNTSQLTQLIPNLTRVHPDEYISKVPYEKGFLFLRYLEDLVGGPGMFEQFLRRYFDAFKFKSLDSWEFKRFFLEYFSHRSGVRLEEIDWDTWLTKPGMPAYVPNYNLTYLEVVRDCENTFFSWDPKIQPEFPIKDADLTTSQKIQLLDELFEEGAQPIEKLESWDRAWNMSLENAEVESRWLRLGLHSKWEAVVQPALDFVTRVGVIRLIQPVYEELYAWEEVRPRAIDTFNKNRPSMMSVAVENIKKVLHLDN